MKIEKLSPAFKDYLWGGTKLRDVYGKKCDYEKVAESWELSTHPAGQSVIDGGEYDGLKFGEYLEKVGAKALGVNGAKFKEFPVLIKFIDAKQPLSVQVHPSDTSDKQGKPEEIPGGTKCALASCPYFTTEKYVVDGEVEIDVTGDSFASLVVTEGSGKVVGSENEVEFKPADSLFVPAGSGKIKIDGHCTVVKTTV